MTEQSTLRQPPNDSVADGQTAIDVHERLRAAILNGEFAPTGAFSQVKLSEELGVSRTPLREALRMLEREGLISTEPNRRARVVQVSIEDLDELYGQRITLEALAVAISVRRFTPSDVAELENYLVEMDRLAVTRDTVAWEVPHKGFHNTLVRYSGDRLGRTISDLRDHGQRYRTRFLTQPLAWEAGAQEHHEIFDAVKAGDPVAASYAAGTHLARTALTLIARMAPEHDAVMIRSALQFVRPGTK